MNHVVQRRDRTICVGDDREIDRRVLRIVDVTDPLFMLINRINANRNRLHAALRKLTRKRCGFAKFSRAHRREIGGVREQNNPRISDPLMKVNRAFGGVLREIGGSVAQTKCGHKDTFCGSEAVKFALICAKYKLRLWLSLCRTPGDGCAAFERGNDANGTVAPEHSRRAFSATSTPTTNESCSIQPRNGEVRIYSENCQLS